MVPLFKFIGEFGRLGKAGRFILNPTLKGAMVLFGISGSCVGFILWSMISTPGSGGVSSSGSRFRQSYNLEFARVMEEAPGFRFEWHNRAKALGVDPLSLDPNRTIPERSERLVNEIRQRLNKVDRDKRKDFQQDFKKSHGSFAANNRELAEHVATRQDLVDRARDLTRGLSISAPPQPPKPVPNRSREDIQKEVEAINAKALAQAGGKPKAPPRRVHVSSGSASVNAEPPETKVSFWTRTDRRFDESVKPMSKYSLPKGHALPVVIMNYVYSSAHKDGGGMVRARVYENVWFQGKLLIPIGSEFLGKAEKDHENGAIRCSFDRLNMFTYRKSESSLWDERPLCRIPLTAEAHANSGRLGLPGAYTSSLTWTQIQVSLLDILGAFIIASQETETNINGESTVASNASNAARVAIAQSLAQAAQSKRQDLQADTGLVMVPAGIKAQIWLTNDLDLAPWIEQHYETFRSFKDDGPPMPTEEQMRRLTVDFTK